MKNKNNDFVAKPIDPQLLIDVIQRWVNIDIPG